MISVVSKTTSRKISSEMFLGNTRVFEEQYPDGIGLTLVTSLDGKRIFFDEKNSNAQLIFSELTLTTAHSFGGDLDETSGDGTIRHLQDHDWLVVLHDEAGTAGFASGFEKEGSLYLHGIAIAPRTKGRGAASRMINVLRQASGLGGITFTTQNPVMFCLLRSICTATYPSPGHGMPEHLQNRATALVQDRPGSFNPVVGVVKELYGRCLYPQLPESSDAEVNAWFAQTLEVSAGTTRHGFVFFGEGFSCING